MSRQRSLNKSESHSRGSSSSSEAAFADDAPVIGKGRLEALSDGIFSVVVTLMVIEFEVPKEATWSALHEVLPVFLAYVLSFIYVGIYWSNHSMMFHVCSHVNGAIVWSNMALLFFISLVPFTTAWMGAHHRDSVPTVLYGIVLALCGSAYKVLQTAIICSQGKDSLLKRAVQRDWKGWSSVIVYAIGIVVGFWETPVSQALFAFIAVIWLIPDPRIERILREERRNELRSDRHAAGRAVEV